jgi:5-methylcytosine-specific restriction endonuclease McrA
MPINYKLYAKNWKTELRPAVLERARHRCECCGVDNYAVVRWDGSRYDFYEAWNNEKSMYEEIQPTTYKEARAWFIEAMSNDYYHDWKVIVLTVAHLDHDIQNNAMSNLKAMCQRCHLQHDRADNARRRKYGKNHVFEQISIF